MREFESVMEQKAPEQLKLEMARQTDTSTYIQSLIDQYYGTRIFEELRFFAALVQPRDRTLGIDTEFDGAEAFLAGSMLGIRIAKQFVPAKVQHKMLGVRVARVNERREDMDAELHQAATTMMHKGDMGMAFVPHMEDDIDRWATDVYDDIRVHGYFRRGFGTVMYMMHEAYEISAREQIERTDIGSIDWDKEFEGLLGPETTD